MRAKTAGLLSRFTAGGAEGTPFRERFRAWWNGEPAHPEPRRRMLPAETAEGIFDGMPAAVAHGRYWTDGRIEVAQHIWGRDHLIPGGDEYVRALVQPLALDPTMTVLELGAGLGGSTRLVHRSFGVWLTGFEADPVLADAGAALSARAGLEKKAPVLPFDPQAATFKKAGFDRVLAWDLIHSVEDKPSLLHAIRDALRKRGQVMLTDFVLRDDGPHDPAVRRWAEAEPVRSRPWSIAAMQACLAELKFKVHVEEDRTERLREAVLDGWQRFQQSLQSMPLPPRLSADMLTEAERWARCAAALASGDLRHCRIVASV